ncbi:MAG: hypothetical protein KDB97_12350 [Flavobacteriales bacterium]|nr:hypothetical protein [Flavobacteriales bacterium]
MYRSRTNIGTRVWLAGGLLAVTLISGLGCTTRQDLAKPNPEGKDLRWVRVDSLVAKGLCVSAVAVIDGIRNDAQRSGDWREEFHAWMAHDRWSEYTGVEREKLIQELEAREGELKGSDDAILRSLLQSVIAEIYWSVYQQQRWRILERTNTAGDPHDMDTWGQRVFMEHVIDAFHASLEARDTLITFPAGDLGPLLIIPGDTARGARLAAIGLRPTLYDVLAHRALDVFLNTETRLAEPASNYRVVSSQAFDLYDDFARRPLRHPDSTAWEFQAMRLFKDLTRLHLSDDGPDALVDLDLKRLAWVRQRSTRQDRDSLYLQALERMRTRLPHDSAWARVTHALAEWHAEAGNNYQRLADDDWKWEKRTAVALCDSVIARWPASSGARDCIALRARLRAPALSVRSEEAQAPEDPFKVSVNYTNCDTLWWRILERPIASDGDPGIDQNEAEQLLKQRPLRSGRIAMPDDGDLQAHVAEVGLDGLPLGQYVLFFANMQRMLLRVDVIVMQPLQVTGLALAERRLPDNTTELLVLDRTTGRPLDDAVVTWQVRDRNRYADREHFRSDGDGMVRASLGTTRGNARWRITFGKDELFTNSRYYWERSDPRPPGPQRRTFFFTDRSIYRPGQTIHYKGILTVKDQGDVRVEAGRAATITLYDVNGQKVAEQAVTADTYGSFNGSFTSPEGTLTGRMRIAEEFGSTWVRVEEYKRPTFEVVFGPITDAPALGGEASIVGTATSYAGVPLDGATVRWQVARTARMPWWCGSFWRGGIPWGVETEIAQGAAACDADGHFTITFIATPDVAIPLKADPLFDYRITADVTDISGETQSGSTTMTVGTQRVMIDLPDRDVLERDSTDSLHVQVKNLNGVVRDLPVDVRIARILPPTTKDGSPLRERLWDVPDRFTMTAEEHAARFPQDVRANEDDPANWPMDRMILERKNLHVAHSALALKGIRNWDVGDYRVEAVTHDADGRTVRVEKHVHVIDATVQHTGFTAEAFHAEPLMTRVEPGEKAVLLLSSAMPGAHVLMDVERDGRVAVHRWITLQQGQQRVELNALEGDRGGFAVHLLCAERGRMHVTTVPIDVPWTNKELHVEWLRFRDKLLPGTEEEWRLRISGSKGEAVAAQLLTAMYDASLDQFVPHDWAFDIWPHRYTQAGWRYTEPFGAPFARMLWRDGALPGDVVRRYPELNTYGFVGAGLWTDNARGYDARAGVMMMAESTAEVAGDKDAERPMALPAAANASEEEPAAKESAAAVTASGPPPVVRQDFRETAFFFPDLLTDRDGTLMLRFKVPDALTRWKVLGLAHTPDLCSTVFSRTTNTQRPLMVTPNLPRFLREGDRIVLTAKIAALEQRVEGPVILELFDPETNARLDEAFGLKNGRASFIAAPGESAAVQWTITVPEGRDLVAVRITARGGGGPMGDATLADGEEHVLPILTDRVLITESLPLPINGPGTKTFTLEKLGKLHPNDPATSTIRHQQLKLEFTPNPAWYAVQALPYLMEFPHECAEQVFSRYYANRLAAHIVEERPAIKAVFAQWKAAGADAFAGALERNEELKGVVLAETPWVMQAKNDRERRDRIGLLFDMERMAGEEEGALRKLRAMQQADGGWPWFKGMPVSRMITQHVVAGMGHLERLGASDLRGDGPTQQMLQRAVAYLDDAAARAYDELLRTTTPKEREDHRPAFIDLQYLYARSFFARWPITGRAHTAAEFLRERLADQWLGYGFQEQAMIAMVLARSGNDAVARDIMASLRERATVDDELGMFWKGFTPGMSWQAFPTETDALLIEAFNEVTHDDEAVRLLRSHLLKLKQTTDWGTTKATAEACYALLLTGPDLLSSTAMPEIEVGDQRIAPDAQEAGTGYFTHVWTADLITPELATVRITSKDDRVSWGALHWQYVQQMDQVTPHESPFSIRKQATWRKPTDQGPVLVPLDGNVVLHPGDELTVRIELRTDRWLDNVHMKDLRAAGLEPIERLSGYRYQGGLGYYQSIRDAAMHFFFDRMPPGTYVFEYGLRVTHAGSFSNGVTTAECMYAPEFSSHGDGLRLRVEEGSR